MKLVQFVLLLVVLTRTATGLFRKKHSFVNIQLIWTQAQTYCRNNYIDLSAINTEAELEAFKTDSNGKTGWIGLSIKTDKEKYTHWSDGTAVGFTKWGNGQPGNNKKLCVYTSDYTWYSDKCDYNYPFYCYTWEPQIIVVLEMKTWEEALVHCRTYYTDLISLTSDIDLVMVNNKSSNALTSRVWTGLHFMDGKWFWVNKEILGSLVSLPSCPVRPFYCGAKTGANIFENRNCTEKMNFICFKTTV